MTLFAASLPSAELPGAFPPPGHVVVRVAVERGIEYLGDQGGLTYVAPEGVAIGERVEAPLGKNNRPTAGIVTEVGGPDLSAGIDPSKVKPILRRTGGALSAAMVELARWMAGYYVCPLGMVLATMMPAAVKRGVGLKKRVLVTRSGAAPAVDLTERLREAWDRVQALDAAQFPMPAKDLSRAIGAPSLAPVNRLIRLGFLEEIVRSEIAGTSMPQDLGVEPADGLVGLNAIPEPTREQSAAISGIAASLGAFSVHLLRGVTGSGKTEVYLRVIERLLAGGAGPAATALVLVPEIALTPQTAGRFIRRFQEHGVAVLHSGLSASQRHRQWSQAASGAARVVIGARSAVFAPLDDLALIIVDEEHDPSYKQDQLPRYHARDLAIKRAQMSNFPVLLGSATPSLESWYNATAKSAASGMARYRLWELRDRVAGARMPRVEVVDIVAEAKARALGPDTAVRTNGLSRFHQIGPTLESAIHGTLRDEGQVILLLNRRGYANYISCPLGSCGWLMQCDDCDAMMVFHKGLIVDRAGTPGFVRCHHCLAEKLLPKVCPVCRTRLNVLGAGTQRVEEELKAKFPDATAMRIDGDTMRSGRDYFEALSRFARGEVRVLLGTQMIAKGLDFPGVRLVGVINADTALAIPDFRAAERTFQLVSQVAGRAGRGREPGRVIVQTASPQAAPIRFAKGHDFIGFATDELRVRHEAGLPPVTKMARIVTRDESLDRAQAAAVELGVALRAAALSARMDQTRIEGPSPCAVGRIAAHFRFELLITSARRAEIQTLLAGVRARGLLTSDSHTAVDIDPVSLM